MAAEIRRIKIAVVLTVVISLAIVLLVPPSVELGVISEVGTGGLPLSADDVSAVPQSVADDATRLATELYGDCQQKCDDFVSQLLALYLEAEDKDFVLIFNPGGWGWNLLEASHDWHGIFTGIQTRLDSLSYTALQLDYMRTDESPGSRLDELMSMVSLHPLKAKDLAYRVEFLTTHISDLRVIVTGESNGTIICDSAMNLLKDNPQVYCIQTGPPFWHRVVVRDRMLVMRGNGEIPDSFSQGDIFTVTASHLEDLFGFSDSYVLAPGHEYPWQLPSVYHQITDFLDENLGMKWR